MVTSSGSHPARCPANNKNALLGAGISRHIFLQQGHGGQLSELIALVTVKAVRIVIPVLEGSYDHLFVKFHGWYASEHDIFLAMEYVEYGILSRYLMPDCRSMSDTIEIERQILEGLDVLHREGIYHRHLKPQV